MHLLAHQLVAISMTLLASDLLEPLLVDPAEEEVLVRVEVRLAHEQLPELGKVINAERHEVVLLLAIILTLDDKVLQELK